MDVQALTDDLTFDLDDTDLSSCPSIFVYEVGLLLTSSIEGDVSRALVPLRVVPAATAAVDLDGVSCVLHYEYIMLPTIS